MTFNITGASHSARKIKNSYPLPQQGSKNCVSKWGAWGLYIHQLGSDPYFETGYNYYKLKTTHYGTLSNYPKTWIGAGGKTHTLTGNTELQNYDTTLKMKQGVTVALNGYYIKRSGLGSGSFTFESGVTLNPNNKLNTNSYELMGLYPSIASALGDAYYSYILQVGSSTQTLSADIEVPTGIAIQFLSGSTINMNNCKITTTNGFIYTESGSNFIPKVKRIKRINSSDVVKGLYPTIVSAFDDINTTTGDKIYLGNITYNEDVNIIENCSLIGQSKNGTIINGTVTISGQNNISLSKMTVNEDITTGGGSGITISEVKAKDIIDMDTGYNHKILNVETINYGYIDLWQTEPDIEDIISLNSVNYGVMGCEADFKIKRGFYENKNRAVYNFTRSDVTIENAEFCSNTYDIYCGSSSSVVVSGVYEGSPGIIMSSCPPPIYGSVTLNDPCMDCNLRKSSPDEIVHEYSLPLVGIDDSPEGLEYTELRNLYHSIKAEISADHKDSIRFDISKYAPKYNQVITGMKAFVAKYPDTEYAQHALKFIA